MAGLALEQRVPTSPYASDPRTAAIVDGKIVFLPFPRAAALFILPDILDLDVHALDDTVT